MNRRSRRYSGQKKPLSTPSIGAALGAAASLLILVLALFIAANTDGSSANIIGGISVLAMILAIATCVTGAHMARNDNFEKISRILGVVVPAIATACGFHGTVYGMGAMCIAMLANYIPRYRAKEITLKSRVPMGPFLLVWLCTGVPLGCIM